MNRIFFVAAALVAMVLTAIGVFGVRTADAQSPDQRPRYRPATRAHFSTNRRIEHRRIPFAILDNLCGGRMLNRKSVAILAAVLCGFCRRRCLD
jgi:hypothetical protein